MADSNHPRSADNTDFAGDDPFAELTRIMGFDPRQPVKRETAPAPAAVDHGFNEADFSIDLEKELMGAFSDDALSTDIAEAQGWPQTAAEPEPAAAAVAQPATAEVALDDDWFDDADFSDDAAPAATAWPQERAPVDAAPVSAFAGPEHDEAFALVEEPQAAPVHHAANDVFAPAEPALEEATELDLDDMFDEALADGDMRFDDPVASLVDPTLDRDLDHELDLSLRDEFDSVERPILHDVAAPVAASPAAIEMSLEDELNALLGNKSLRAAVAAPAAPEPVMDDEPAFELDAVDEEPSEEVRFDQRSDAVVAAEEDVAFDVQDFDWQDDAGYEQQPESDQSPSFVFANDQPVLDEVELAESPAFDDEAFDAVLTRSFAVDDHDLAEIEPEQIDEPVAEPAPAARRGYDPYAAVSALGSTLRSIPSWGGRSSATESRSPVGEIAYDPIETPAAVEADVYEQPAVEDVPAMGVAARADDADYAPDIETLDVPEAAVALADDLDLPDFAFEEAPVAAPSYDDIDAEFTSLLNEMNAAEAEQSEPARTSRYDDLDDEIATASASSDSGPYAGTHYAAAAAGVAAAAVAASARTEPARAAASPRQPATTPAAEAADAIVEQEFADMEFAYDPDLDEEMALPQYTPVAEPRRAGRGLMIAAVVGGVALLGGVGAFALSFGGGSGSDEPALIRADATPVKVKPENPGGTTVPNQDNKVYDSVAGSGEDTAEQETLVTAAEEPVDMPGLVDDSAEIELGEAEVMPPTQKSEDRIEQIVEEAGVDSSVEVAAVAPRKVRTMIVKADGTLVAREEPAPAVNPITTGTAEPVAPAPDASAVEPLPAAVEAETLPQPAAPETNEVPQADNPVPAVTEEAAPAPQPTEVDAQAVAMAAAIEDTAEPALAPVRQTQSSTTPNSVPVAPARPSDQPVDIVGEVKADQVAAVSTAAAAPGAWAMQIASQPTEAAANASYQDLARRYGSVLGGRQATIVKAEIEGKGTFWRVRIPAGTRNEAITLCETYKSAGGNCFVSR